MIEYPAPKWFIKSSWLCVWAQQTQSEQLGSEWD